MISCTGIGMYIRVKESRTLVVLLLELNPL